MVKRYYGTPRHLRVNKDIPWAGDIHDCQVKSLWEPEVEMRIPAGKNFFYFHLFLQIGLLSSYTITFI